MNKQIFLIMIVKNGRKNDEELMIEAVQCKSTYHFLKFAAWPTMSALKVKLHMIFITS